MAPPRPAAPDGPAPPPGIDGCKPVGFMAMGSASLSSDDFSMVSPTGVNVRLPTLPAVSSGSTEILTLLISMCVCTMPTKKPIDAMTASQCRARALDPRLTVNTSGSPSWLFPVAYLSAANICELETATAIENTIDSPIKMIMTSRMMSSLRFRRVCRHDEAGPTHGRLIIPYKASKMQPRARKAPGMAGSTTKTLFCSCDPTLYRKGFNCALGGS